MYNNIMTYTEEFEQLFEDSDIMKISGCVGMRTNDDKIRFLSRFGVGRNKSEVLHNFKT